MLETTSQGLTTGMRAGNHVIREMLGKGGFGITYRATNDALLLDVPVKASLPHDLAARMPEQASVRQRPALTEIPVQSIHRLPRLSVSEHK